MRVFLLFGVFLDQYMIRRFRNIYPAFKSNFNYPKLYSHPDNCAIGPGWLLDSGWEPDDKIDWNIAKPTARLLLGDILLWLSQLPDGDAIVRKFLTEMENQIASDFGTLNAGRAKIFLAVTKEATARYIERNHASILLGDLLLMLSRLPEGDAIIRKFLYETENRIEHEYDFEDARKISALIKISTRHYLSRNNDV